MANFSPSTTAAVLETAATPCPNRQSLLWVSFVITLLYLLAEIVYNVGLVRMLSTPGLSKETIEGMEVIGKAMASIGITLFISRLVQLRRAWLYLLLTVVIYLTLGVAVNRVIDQLPEHTKRAGHWLGMYRVAALEGHVADQSLNTPGHALSSGQRMALVNLALLMYGDQREVEKAARQYLVAKVGDHINYAALEHDFDRFWRTYSDASAKLEPLWDWYRKKILAEEQRNPTLREFVAEVEKSAQYGGKMHEYNRTVLYKGNPVLGLAPVTARNIPLFLNQEQLRNYVSMLIESEKFAAANHFAPDAGKTSAQSAQLTRDLSFSVFIPPVSMSLSLFSTFLNVASLVGVALALALSAAPGKWSNPRLVKAAQCLTVAATLGALALLDMPPFQPHSQFATTSARAAQDSMLQRLWIGAINREELLLETVGSLSIVRAAGDKLPWLGRSLTI